jgi:homoserine O-acetyltransferase
MSTPVAPSYVLPPASGAWREGDPVGRRRFVDVGDVALELGATLPEVRVAYETWGRLDAEAANAVLVLHALTGDSHVVGEAGPGHPTPGWWDGLIGSGAPIDPADWFVVSANVLGGCQGTTGPSSPAPDGRPYGSRFPRITIRDQVEVEARLAEQLGVTRWALIVGGSMGGMRALEWLVSRPSQVAAGLVLAVGAAASADQIATQTAQNLAITADPRWNGGDYYDAPAGGGPTTGMGVARRIAHLTYRTEFELEERFANRPQADEDPLVHGRYAVQSYLDHHADKLARRFDAGTYVALTDTMNTWDLGRGRGGIEAALARVEAPVVVGGIDSDRLYPLWQQRQLAELLPDARGGLRVLRSDVGHDGFLVERDQVFDLVTEALELAADDSAEQRRSAC